VTIAGGISNSSRIIAYHLCTGLHIQVEETELGKLAEDSQVLLIDTIHVQGKVEEVGKTRGVDAE